MTQVNTTFQILDLRTGNVLGTQVSKKETMAFSFVCEFEVLKKAGELVVVQSWKDGDKEAKIVKS
jgi:hypothetical protein